MASFNLGSIKGPKGDIGPKGDKGDKGDTGARGIKGEDGITPVFLVERVDTLPAGSQADVTVDSSNVMEPRLHFFIPAGKDGVDAAGDMQKSIYDIKGLNCDFYAYAQELFSKAVSTDGSVMSGKLVASGENIDERCVRNIIFSNKLPDSTANGDICFVMGTSAGRKLSECEIGTVLLLDEGPNKEQYVVAAKNYYGNNEIALVRRYLTKSEYYFDYSRRESYSCSDIDFYLESVLAESFGDDVKKHFVFSSLDGYDVRRCFLPSKTELENMEYFVENGVKASHKWGFTGESYMSRDVTSSNYIYVVNSEGSFSSKNQKQKFYIRPMITLDGAMYVENSIDEEDTVSIPINNCNKLYYYENGLWKELMA